MGTVKPSLKLLLLFMLFAGCSAKPARIAHQTIYAANSEGDRVADVQPSASTSGDVAVDEDATDDVGGENIPILSPKIFDVADPFFVNPIISHGFPDVVQRDGFYYSCFLDFQDDNIFFSISRSKRLQDIGREVPTAVFQISDNASFSENIGDPQLQFINDRWYIYFTGTGDDDDDQMFVLESLSNDPLKGFQLAGKITPFTNHPAIYVNTVTINNQLYLLWEGQENSETFQTNIYLAPMVNPVSVNSRPEFVQRVEAEASVIKDGKILAKETASAGATVAFTDLGTSSIEFTVTTAKAGSFAMDIGSRGLGPDGLAKTASQQLFVNGQLVEQVKYPFGAEVDGIQTSTRLVNLKAGSNKIKLQKDQGTIEIDYIEVKTPNVDGVAIASPEQEFEFERSEFGFNFNGRPVALQKNGKTYITFTVNEPVAQKNALGILELIGTDPMRRESWKKTGPVFSSSSELFGPGNAVFVKSPNGAEDWMVYDHNESNADNSERRISIKKFTFDANGFPDFGIPEEQFQRIVQPAE